MRYPVRRQISPHAAQLRRDQTDVERTLWFAVRNRRLDGAKFRRQVTIAPYIVDFLCVEAMLIVELDGGQHNEEVDAARTQFLEAKGYRVLRFWNNDVVENLDGVLETIVSALKKKTLTQPSPAKAGEGEKFPLPPSREREGPAAVRRWEGEGLLLLLLLYSLAPNPSPPRRKRKRHPLIII